tara:strand:- start:241 stop:1434 length:1194 start_codon:yes stop_codon:yes gene_type:complete
MEYYDEFTNEGVTGERPVPQIEGKMLPKRYMALQNIGEGGFCFVWLCYRFRDDTFWAVKMFHADERAAGKQEIKLMEKVGKIPGIIHLEETFEWGRHRCLVYPLYGKPLCDQNNDAGIVDDYHLPYEAIESFGNQIENSIHLLYKNCGLIHTDIRPENILLKEPSEEHRQIIESFQYLKPREAYTRTKAKYKSKLMAKALSKLSAKLFSLYESSQKIEVPECSIDEDTEIVIIDLGNAIDITKQNEDIQSRYYQCPEVMLGLPYDYKCDLWSIGCVLYEIATNDILFDPNDKNGKTHFVCDHLQQICTVLGEKVPEEMRLVSPKRQKIFIENSGDIQGFDKEEFQDGKTALKKLLTENLDEDHTDTETILEQLPQRILHYLKYKPEQRGVSNLDMPN